MREICGGDSNLPKVPSRNTSHLVLIKPESKYCYSWIRVRVNTQIYLIVIPMQGLAAPIRHVTLLKRFEMATRKRPKL